MRNLQTHKQDCNNKLQHYRLQSPVAMHTSSMLSSCKRKWSPCRLHCTSKPATLLYKGSGVVFLGHARVCMQLCDCMYIPSTFPHRHGIAALKQRSAAWGELQRLVLERADLLEVYGNVHAAIIVQLDQAILDLVLQRLCGKPRESGVASDAD